MNRVRRFLRVYCTLSTLIILIFGVCIGILYDKHYLQLFAVYKLFTKNDEPMEQPTPEEPKYVPRNFPYLVYLLIELPSSNATRNCAGTLIGIRHVLTAAHCINGSSSITLKVGIDDITVNEEKYVFRSQNYTVHEDYDNKTYDNDIGLVYLNQDVIVDNASVKIINLPTVNIEESEDIFIAVGWADRKGLNNIPSKKIVLLVNASVCRPLVPESVSCDWDLDSDCQYKYSDCDVYLATKLCASPCSGVPCHGDSGGPLMLLESNIQIGIVSFGVETCNRKDPATYTNVAFYLEWIELNTKKHL